MCFRQGGKVQRIRAVAANRDVPDYLMLASGDRSLHPRVETESRLHFGITHIFENLK